MKSIRIGCGSASWGDMLDPAVELAERGNVQYIGFDHLAELTMSILQRMKQKDPRARLYPGPPAVDEEAPARRAREGHPHADQRRRRQCRGRRERRQPTSPGASATAGSRSGSSTATTSWPACRSSGRRASSSPNLDTGEDDIDRIADKLVSANAYIGSEGQIQALAEGADLVITGRATDSSVHIAPMVHEFGWSTEDWDLMGAAIAIGHIIECSSGCAGGMSNFWKEIPEPWRVAFPIAEMVRERRRRDHQVRRQRPHGHRVDRQGASGLRGARSQALPDGGRHLRPLGMPDRDGWARIA